MRLRRGADVQLTAFQEQLTEGKATCKYLHTGVCDDGGEALNSKELIAIFVALSHPQRLRVVAELAGGRVHVSELARRLGLSRPLLYLHLERLEKAGIVVGRLELSESGKAMKYFELAPFDLHLNLDTVLDALRADAADPGPGDDGGPGDGEEPQTTPEPTGEKSHDTKESGS
jgi:DNA-binding transcriptional ArsR family regulator